MITKLPGQEQFVVVPQAVPATDMVRFVLAASEFHVLFTGTLQGLTPAPSEITQRITKPFKPLLGFVNTMGAGLVVAEDVAPDMV